jgi:DNA-binding HxlR family transcriptional regulator/putative sterol carrier protein
MASKRSYEDGCATAHALDLIGERWALLVVRELILGPKRFTDLRELPPPASSWVYELTDWGLDLEPVIMSLGRWAVHSPALMQGHPLSTDALILSFRTMFSSEAAGDLKASIELRIGEDRFHANVTRGEMTLIRGAASHPDVIITADPNILAALAHAGRKLPDAIRAGEVGVEGDRGVARRFLGLFPMPEAAEG